MKSHLFTTTAAGERLIQFATEQCVVEVLISPQLYTLQQCIRNMLGSFTRHRHLIHAGYTLAGSGAWLLQVSHLNTEDMTWLWIYACLLSIEEAIIISFSHKLLKTNDCGAMDMDWINQD